MRRLFSRLPDAVATVFGDVSHPSIEGTVKFFTVPEGVVVLAEIFGLAGDGFFGFHIHEDGSCTGSPADPFADSGRHYSKRNPPHPSHSGDLPPLLSAGGYAMMAVLSNRFTVDEVMGRTVIIHSSADDFTTQPSGNAGHKIACGVISPVRRM